MKKICKLPSILIALILLSGCLYPEGQLAKNQVPYKNQLDSVQYAVDQFREDSDGLLPIKTRENETPIYQKYPIDFNKLSPRYIQEPPGNAFESGGIFQYVLVDVENDPTVKLIDLLLVEPIRELKMKINFYRDKHGYPPFKERVGNGVYSLKYEELGYETPPYVVSPYSRQNLSLLIDGDGEIYIDYGPDLYHALNNFDHEYEYGDDIRELLVKEYDFVPVFSVPYTIEQGEPVFY